MSGKTSADIKGISRELLGRMDPRQLGGSAITRIVLVVILIIFMASVYHSANAKDVPMDTIEHSLKTETDLGSMTRCSNRQLMQFIGLDYSNYQSYIYYKSKEALGVDELLIVKAHNRDDLTAVQDAVEQRIADQIQAFSGYGPDQVAELKNAVIYKRGNYLFYCTAKDPDQYEGVFRHVI